MYTETIRNLFIMVTIFVLGTICFVRMGTIDLHAVCATGVILVPAVFILGYIGQLMGEIVDNPRNKADADYKIAVLNALKKMDKSITLEELNQKLSRQAEEPDIPDKKDDVDE